MYYLNKHSDKQSYRRTTAFFILSVFLLTIHSYSFAQNLEQEAENYRTKGYEEQQKGNLDQALTYYLKAVTLGGGSASVYNDVGVTYEQLGLEERAEENYLKAIQIDPNYLPPYTNLAFLYQKRRDIKRAVMFFRERYRLAPEDDPWKAKVAQELLRLDPSFREEFLRNVLEEAKTELRRKRRDELQMSIMRADQNYQRGMSLLAEKKYQEALEEFERALMLTPDNPKMVKARERALLGKRIEAMRRRFDEAVDKMETGQLESAKSIFQDILTLIPSKSVLTPE